MFTIDPVSGNSLGFEPNKLLTPKDAFEVRTQGSPNDDATISEQPAGTAASAMLCTTCRVGVELHCYAWLARDRCLTRTARGTSTSTNSRGCWYGPDT